MVKNKSNVCGIVGLSTGWFMPIAGFVLGIISLSRKEPNQTLGILSIIESIVSFFIWFHIYVPLI